MQRLWNRHLLHHLLLLQRIQADRALLLLRSLQLRRIHQLIDSIDAGGDPPPPDPPPPPSISVIIVVSPWSTIIPCVPGFTSTTRSGPDPNKGRVRPMMSGGKLKPDRSCSKAADISLSLSMVVDSLAIAGSGRRETERERETDNGIKNELNIEKGEDCGRVWKFCYRHPNPDPPRLNSVWLMVITTE